MEPSRTEIGRLSETVKAMANGASDETLRKRAMYLDLLIEREAERAKWRRAVIEKTAIGLLLFILGWAATHAGRAVLEYVANHMPQHQRKDS